MGHSGLLLQIQRRSDDAKQNIHITYIHTLLLLPHMFHRKVNLVICVNNCQARLFLVIPYMHRRFHKDIVLPKPQSFLYLSLFTRWHTLYSHLNFYMSVTFELIYYNMYNYLIVYIFIYLYVSEHIYTLSAS